MGDVLDLDYISDLPQSIIESILAQLPIRDAVRTSFLSSTWRYKWASISNLVFDEKFVPLFDHRDVSQQSLVKFITTLLLLHQGPIHKFQITNLNLQSCLEIDKWILFLSRNEIKKLILELGAGEFYRAPSCLFNCKKLTYLHLLRCELDPPPSFKGFMCLKCLRLDQVFISPDAIQSLISNCHLLEGLSLSYLNSLALTIRAPNLKFLFLEGEFKDICLEDTPLLVEIYLAMYMTNDIAEHFEQSSNCNFVKFLGGLPNLKKLVGLMGFTKYLSKGNDPGHLPIMYKKLEIIELYQVSFEDMKEILVVLRLITSSPNLKELQISGSSIIHNVADAQDLGFWEKECPDDATLRQLKVVKLTGVWGVPHEMEFIKFLLGCSPVLETMMITSSAYDMEIQLKMSIEMLKFRRASSRAEIVFVHE